ncbi:MAG: hypothetical protein ACK4UJ_08140 [Leptonema sp. (in: bacteria)]
MAIQDIDFAKQISKEKKPNFKESKQNKSLQLYLFIFFLGYTFGVYSGFQLSKFKQLEENLIVNPDKLEENHQSIPQNFNNTSTNATSHQEGTFLIFLGNFSPKKSSELIKSLKSESLYNSFSFYECKGLIEKDFKKGIFRVPSLDGKVHKVYVGCFLTEEEAVYAIEQLKSIKQWIQQKFEIVQIQEKN